MFPQINLFIAQRIDYGVTGDIITNDSTSKNLLTHLFQGKEWVDRFGFDFVTRTYDPYTMRMLQIDSCLKAIKIESYLKFKDNWGIIKTNDNDIFIENWYSKDFQTGRGIRTKRGKIIDNKTFIFDEVKNSDGDFEKINEKYRFVKFNPKPDSTNKWIK